jgi:hypothetical protein
MFTFNQNSMIYLSYFITAFGCERVEDLDILPTDKLEHVKQKIRNASQPRVNECAQPIKDAIEMKNSNIDVFVYYTDSETWLVFS